MREPPPPDAGLPGEQWHRIHPPPRLSAPRLVRPVGIDPSGVTGPTTGQSRGPRWRRTGIGLYVPTRAATELPAQRILEATGFSRGVCAVTGWASLHLAGARWFEGRDAHGRDLPVPLRIGPRGHARAADGVLLDRRRAHPGDLVSRHGIACLNVHRSLFDEVVRRGDARQGAAAIDMVFFAELTTPSRFAAWLATLPRTPGLPLVRRALAFAAEGAESPQETALRLLWRFDAMLPAPLCNVDIHADDGRFLGRADLMHPGLGITGEYNGSHHLDVREHSRDLTRIDAFRDHGLEVVTVVGGELRRTPAVVERLQAAVRRASASSAPPRWVLHGPAGPRPGLEERFAFRLRSMSRARAAGVLADTPTAVGQEGFDVPPVS